MKFIIWGIIYIVIAIALLIIGIVLRSTRKIKYIENNYIIKAKVIGDVISRNTGIEEHHAVLAYLIDGEMYKKECSNGFNQKLYEVGEIVDIKYNPNNYEDITLLREVPNVKFTPIEIASFIIAAISGPLMFVFRGLFVI